MIVKNLVLLLFFIPLSCSNQSVPILDWEDLRIENLTDPEYWKKPMISDKAYALNGKTVIAEGLLVRMPEIGLELLVDTTARITGGPCGFFSPEDIIELVYTNDSLKTDLENKKIYKVKGAFQVSEETIPSIFKLVDCEIISQK